MTVPMMPVTNGMSCSLVTWLGISSSEKEATNIKVAKP
jgi:hypothetical protein